MRPPRRDRRHRRPGRGPHVREHAGGLRSQRAPAHAVGGVFHNLTASETSPALQAVEREMMPRFAAHQSAVRLHEGLFARIDALHGRRDELGLAPEEMRLLERVHLDFVREGRAAQRRRAGALRGDRGAPGEARTRASARTCSPTRPASGWSCATRPTSRGCPRACARRGRGGGAECGEGDGPVVTLSRSLIVPFLTFSTPPRPARARLQGLDPARRERRRARQPSRGPRDPRACASSRRGCTATPTTPITRSWTAWPRTPAAVAGCWARCGSRPRPARPRSAMRWRKWRAPLGETHAIEPWDWRHYAEKVRTARYGLDDAQLKPYFSLDRMLAAAFDTAQRLFGISFDERGDIRAYHPDVRVFEVRGRDGRPVGVFLSDNFARPTKRGGAWMSAYRLAIAQRRRDAARSSSTTTTSPRRRRASRRCCRPTTCARSSTSSATACTGCCRRSPTSACPARRCCATSWSCPRRSSSTGASSRRC